MFVDRVNGAITAVYAARQHPDQEELADDHADVVAFRAAMSTPPTLTPQQKLERIGLTVSELRALIQ